MSTILTAQQLLTGMSVMRADQYRGSADRIPPQTLRDCVAELKSGQAVEIPVYSFVEHQRTKETQYLYGASVVIIEGLFVLSDPALRDLMDLKLFGAANKCLVLHLRLTSLHMSSTMRLRPDVGAPNSSGHG